MLLLFLFTNLLVQSQEKLIIVRELLSNDIEVITDGLDDIVLENSKNNLMEVVLLDENPNTHTVYFEEGVGVLRMKFKLDFNTQDQQVFRKYITKRLQRARAIIKIPVNKSVIIHGKTIGVTSENYQGDLKIYIDKGNVKLNRIKGNALVKLFLGNVFAKLRNRTSINVETNKGEIFINNTHHKNRLYKKENWNSIYNFNIRSVNANVFLITE